MFLERQSSHKRTIKILQAHHEAVTNRRLEPLPMVRHPSKADPSHPKRCQYPIRDATKAQMRAGDESWKCMASTKENSPYCCAHHAICYIAVKLVLTDIE